MKSPNDCLTQTYATVLAILSAATLINVRALADAPTTPTEVNSPAPPDTRYGLFDGLDSSQEVGMARGDFPEAIFGR